MEGTRHERVVTVLSAYIIGFTTAFIAFGVTQIEEAVNFVYVPVPSQTAAVIDALPADDQPAALSNQPVYLTEAGLVYNDNGSETLISAFGESGDIDGVHQSIFEFSLSPDGQFLYFCEVPAAAVEACKPFVYDTNEGAVYPVTEGGERIALPLTATELTWDKTGLVAISGLAVDPNPIR